MATLNISLPEEMKAFVETQVARGGYSTASEYVRFLIRQAQQRQAEEELEAKLLEGLASERKEMGREDWDKLRARVRARHKKVRRA